MSLGKERIGKEKDMHLPEEGHTYQDSKGGFRPLLKFSSDQAADQ